MLSLIASKLAARILVILALPIVMAVSSVAYARDGFGQPLLEEMTVAAVGRNSEIHINFSSEIRYLGHFPTGKGNVLKINLDVVNPCLVEGVLAQETRELPSTDWHVPATVTFPDAIKRSSSTQVLCRTTRNLVDVGHTVTVNFGKEVEYRVRPGGDGRSIIVEVPLLRQPEAGALRMETKMPQPELAASVLMMNGRTALSSGNAVDATQYFNRLLNLPPNEYSQEAQELVGVAREKAGEIEKAQAEYQLYLQLYPAGDGAERVKSRLAALGLLNKPEPAKPTAKAKPSTKPVKQVHLNTFTGSVSQYYYAGKTQSRSINGAGEVSKLRSTDQSTLITNVDATERMRHNQYDTKIVFRDTQVHHFLSGRVDRNTVSAAFIEHQNKARDYMFRLGRQSGTSQGVLGRFDGVFGRYGINPQWRITAVAGVPDNGSQSSVKTDRHFYGAGVEFGPLAEKWSGTVYGIQQVADGLAERRAFGTELRYFNGTTSWFGLVDYDTIYDELNMAMLQGNWTAEGGYNFNLLLDHRKSPILYGETAIQGLTGARSVQDLRVMLSAGEIYSYVKGLVPESDMAMFGVTKQVTDRWQVGGDVRVTHIGATDGIPPSALNPLGFPAQPGIKNNYTYTLQAIGTNTLFKNDTAVIMGSYVQDPEYNAQNLTFSHSLMLQEKWRIDSALRYYHEDRDAGQKTWKVTPSLRLNYRWRDNMSFEAELNIDRTHTDDPVAVTKTDTWRETLFAGYRWDFR